MSLLIELKDFIMKGDVLNLAVAFVMGAAFNALITSLVTDIVTPIIGIPGHVNLASITYSINGSVFLLGAFLNSIIAFVSISLAVFFFIIKPVSKIQNMKKPKPATAPNTKICPYCLSNIPVKATRCAFCTSKLK